MKDSITFALKQIGTTNFWMMFIAAFTSLLMFKWRNSVRDEVYKQAAPQRKWR